jgi:hypothetical protein
METLKTTGKNQSKKESAALAILPKFAPPERAAQLLASGRAEIYKCLEAAGMKWQNGQWIAKKQYGPRGKITMGDMIPGTDFQKRFEDGKAVSPVFIGDDDLLQACLQATRAELISFVYNGILYVQRADQWHIWSDSRTPFRHKEAV